MGEKIMTVQLAMKEDTPPEEVETYVKCVCFLAYWLEKQDGVLGKDPQELFDEFREHVTDRMMGPVEGSA